jgi:hypothetical protein
MININKIESDELRKNLLKIEKEIIESYISDGQKSFHKILTEWTIGIGKPISIADSEYRIHDDKIELLVNYQVTYGYIPYQRLESPIHLFIKLDQESIRDYKLKEICQ